MLECLCANHNSTFDELLEWPYRRVIKVFDAWQRRNAVDEVENRKNLHVNALQGIIEWKDEGDQNKAIEDVEEYYECLKDLIWEPTKNIRENEEMRELEKNDSFLAAGRRNLQRIVSPKYPNQDEIEETLNE